MLLHSVEEASVGVSSKYSNTYPYAERERAFLGLEFEVKQ